MTASAAEDVATVTSPPSHTGGRLSVVGSLPLHFVAEIEYCSIREEPVAWEALQEAAVLGADLEAMLFRQMNLAFRCASELRDSLQGSSCVAEPILDEIERLAGRGDRIRNALAVVFTKLTHSIARSYVSPRFGFDELASEAQHTALYAISKFNPDRGFRFSTYATLAIRRRLIRFVQGRATSHEVSVDWQRCGLPESGRWTYRYERAVTNSIRTVDSLLMRLSPRERYVIRSRFGWGRDFHTRTLQEIADEQGVSRERIRQLEARALAKLRTFAQRELADESLELGC